MSARTCSICGEARRLLLIAAEDGVVVSGSEDDPHEGHHVQAGDVVCIFHVAVRPDGEYVIEFEWNGWSGVLGACWDHDEDLRLMALKAKAHNGADELGEDVPRD